MSPTMQRTCSFQPSCAASKRSRVLVRSTSKDSSVATSFRKGALAGLVAVQLLASGPNSLALAAQQPTLAEQAAEREQMVELQKQQLEYLLEQQAIVKKAQLAQQRQFVQAQVTSVETQLSQRLIEQRAGAVQAEKVGDARLAAQVAAQEAELEEKMELLQRNAAIVESKLDRAEMIQKAKLVAEKQALEKEAKAVKDEVTEQLDKWMESIAAMK